MPVAFSTINPNVFMPLEKSLRNTNDDFDISIHTECTSINATSRIKALLKFCPNDGSRLVKTTLKTVFVLCPTCGHTEREREKPDNNTVQYGEVE